MRCFHLSVGSKNAEPKMGKSASAPANSSPLFSASSNKDTTRSGGSDFNSHDLSDFSTASSAKNSFAALSQRHSNLRVFSFSELKAATKNFSRSLMIGEGGFGTVYKGVIRRVGNPDKKMEVAIKQLGRRGLQGHKEWVTEVNFLGIVEHPNLVRLVGYCAEDDDRGIQRLLVYEYMPNRSVQDHLSSRIQPTLPWTTRLKIAQDAARGLAYLHEGMEFQIIFRDFKSSNILLDEHWNAKLSDFGLARVGPSNGLSHISTMVVGTIGYAAPEYMQTGRLTFKSDVWAYGVFLYELITGRRPMDRSRPKDEQNLLEWVRPHVVSGSKKFRAIMDPKLAGHFDAKSARKLSLVANRCLIRQVKMRPTMSEVVEMVDRIVDACPTGGELGGSPFEETGDLILSGGGRESSVGRRLKGWLENGGTGCLGWAKWKVGDDPMVYT